MHLFDKKMFVFFTLLYKMINKNVRKSKLSSFFFYLDVKYDPDITGF